MTRSFDLVVVGTGPAASTVARKIADQGKRVAIVESRAFGGTCALRGCNPKKVYVNAADLVARARGGQGKLVRFDQCGIDWAELLSFKRQFTEPVAQKSEQGFADDGIETFSATARFNSPNELVAGDTVLRSDRFFIATGARPAPLSLTGAEYLTHSDEFLELASLPDRIVFVGGGYISMEFAFAAALAGTEVTVVDRGERILKPFDPDLTEQLSDWSRGQGIHVNAGAEVKEIGRDDDGTLSVHCESDGRTEILQCDLAIHGAGRVPNLDDLNLAAGGVEFDQAGIAVDSYLRSKSNPAVFAAGDCAATGQPPLTPVANEEARAVVANLFDVSPAQQPDYGVVPGVAFTTPPIAAVGLAEQEARNQYQSLDVRHEDTSSWGSVRKSGIECAGYKILIDEATDKIVGAHLLGPGADETINLFALAMKFDLTARDLKSTLFAFPTFASDVRNMV